LLSHCVIDFPRREEARFPLFEAQVNAKTYERALGTFDPGLLARFRTNRRPETGVDEEILTSDDQEQEGAETPAAPALELALSRAQQARFAEMIGETMGQLDRLDESVPYLQTAQKFEDSAIARKQLARKIAAIKEILRIQRLNSARQPLLHEALEQDRVVRPRLTARAAPGISAGGKGGTQQ
jgi:hypothetical protein